MKQRRGSSLWGETDGMASWIYRFEPGDLVVPIAMIQSDFLGVVKEVMPKLNKVMVLWGGGSLKQHDPDEIMLHPYQDSIVKSRMASSRRSKKADFLGVPVQNPPSSRVQTDFLSPEMEGLLNRQVGVEMYSAYIYFMYAAWFQSKGLVGFQAWMERQGDDEIEHAMKVYKYLVDTGSDVELPAIDAPTMNPLASVLEVTRAVLDHEMTVTQDWKRIGQLAKSEDNPATFQMVQEFIKEQIEEEDGAVTLHQKVQLADSGSGILMVDNDLKDRDPNAVTASVKMAVDKAVIPETFMNGRSEIESIELEVSSSTIRANVTTRQGKVSSYTYPNDWKRGWHNGIKKMLNLSMMQDGEFDEWVSKTFKAKNIWAGRRGKTAEELFDKHRFDSLVRMAKIATKQIAAFGVYKANERQLSSLQEDLDKIEAMAEELVVKEGKAGMMAFVYPAPRIYPSILKYLNNPDAPYSRSNFDVVLTEAWQYLNKVEHGVEKELQQRRVAADNPVPSGDQFVGDPETHGINAPRGGGFSIMQDLQKDLHKEMKKESDVETNPRVGSRRGKASFFVAEGEKASDSSLKSRRATMKMAGDSVPHSLGQWNVYAGGTGVEEGYNSYDTEVGNIRTGGRKYSISPVSNDSGRFQGYFLSVFPGKNHGHSGIDVKGEEVMVNTRQSLFRSPIVAVRAAVVHDIAAGVPAVVASVGDLRSRGAMEFPTQDAMDKYLKEHPEADKSNHKVVETKKDAPVKLRKEDLEVKTNQYIPRGGHSGQGLAKNYYYIQHKDLGVYHHKDKKFRKKPLTEMTTHWYENKDEAEKDLNGLVEEPKAASVGDLRSRRAMYWGAPDRVYRLTKEEQDSGSAICPKCQKEMALEPFTKSEKLYTCQKCGFKVPTSKTTTTRITIDVDKDGEVDVDVTTAKGKKTRRGTMFPTQNAMREYMREHPDADKSQHKVAPEGKKPWQTPEGKRERKLRE